MKFPTDRPVKVVMLGAGGTGGYVAPYVFRLLHMLDRPVESHEAAPAVPRACPLRFSPVSYTHLDVYKRQCISFIGTPFFSSSEAQVCLKS